MLPGDTLDAATTELEDRLHRLALEHGISATVRFSAARNHPAGGTPAETAPDTPLVALLRACAATDGPAVVGAAPYWSELPLLAEIGIPGVYFGPGDIATCHTPRERVPVADLVRVADALHRFLLSSADAPAVGVHHSTNKEET